MKKRLTLDYLLYLTARFFSIVLMKLPVGLALSVGRLFGRVAYLVNHKRAKVAYSNMRAAFCADMPPFEMRSLVKGLYKNFGQVLVEVLRIPAVDKGYIQKYITIENRHNFDEAVAKKRGIIFLTGHFGNWELSSITSALQGYSLVVLAREQKMTRLNDALNRYRESKGCRVVKKGMATREIFEHLRSNGVVGILSDQDAGKKGVFVRFFGRPTSSARGAFVLAQRTGALIIPTFMVRMRGPYHRLVLECPIEVKDGENGQHEALQRFTSVLESYVRRYPEQWLWLHKRWKSTPLRRVVILSDGKTGHLNQSLAVFEKIRECRQEYGYRDQDTVCEVIKIEFGSTVRRAIFELLSGAFSRYVRFRMPLLSYCLTPRCYRKLAACYADIVISCGAETAHVNVLFSRENNAKNIVIMKPPLLSYKDFTLAIVPRHDNPPSRDNILVTTGAHHTMSPERLEKDLFSMTQHAFDVQERRNIGLLIGGENKYYDFDEDMIKKVASEVAEAAMDMDMNILATTSRRTPTIISDILRGELEKSGRAKLMIIANEQNPPWSVGGILAASDVVVVSGESSSMVSEAASSGKHVVVFLPKKRPRTGKNDKHRRFLRELCDDGIAHISDIKKLKDTIIGLVGSGQAPKRLNDDKKLYEAVRRFV